MEGIRLTDKIFKDTYYWIFEGYEIRFNLDSLEVEGNKGEISLTEEEVMTIINEYNLALSLPDYDIRLIDLITDLED